MAMELIKSNWLCYKKYMHLCYVDTLPYKGGFWWELVKDPASRDEDNGIAFIGYTYPFAFNQCRERVFSVLADMGLKDKTAWINENLLLLSRVMVQPEYRGGGLAKRIINETIGLLPCKYVECLTSGLIIQKTLEATGFIRAGWDKNKLHHYYYRSVK